MANYPVTFSAEESELVTLHHPEPALWILELKNGVDSRLTGDMCQKAIIPALNVVEKDWRAGWRAAQKSKTKDKGVGAGALIIIGRMDQQKFFSNGFDYEQVINTPGLGFIYSQLFILFRCTNR
jgi:Delta3-Delta2-enoyl-CoA isomerase